MQISRILRLLCCLCAMGLASCAGAQNKKGIDPMVEEQVRELSALSGSEYVTRRNEFLTTAPALPDYPFGLADQDPRFRVQYLILQGWQKNAGIQKEMQSRIESVNVDFMSRTAAGLSPFYGETRMLSAQKWRYDGLAFAWEDILKFKAAKPDWQIHSSLEVIRGFPHSDSIDPLLIAMHLEPNWSETIYINILTDMPTSGLKERLEIDRQFYKFTRPMIEDALRGQVARTKNRVK